jgi:hypothetical protein
MTKLHASLLASIAAASVIVACTSTTSGGGGASSSGASSSGTSSGTTSSGSSSGGADAQQCSDLAKAACTILAQCDTFDMQALFAGSATTCAARLVYSCPSVSESGTSNSGSSIEACASALGQITTCDAYASYLASTNGNLCAAKPGTLANGTSCFDDSQCSGGFCGAAAGDAAAGSNCGSCAATPPATACQENSNCPSGELCNGQGACVTPGQVGATCDSSDPSQANQPCQPQLFCKFASSLQPEDGGAAPTSGTCAALLASGAACDSTDPAEECADGLFCNAQNQCAKVTFVPLGGACDEIGLVCAGAACAFTSADANADGVCTAYAADGAACQQDTDCQYGASCQNAVCSSAVATSCN